MNQLKKIVSVALLLLFTISPGNTLSQEEKQVDMQNQSKPPVAVETVKIVAADINESVEVVGTLAVKFKAEIKAEYPGVVKGVYVTRWVQVKKGDKLAEIDNREAQALVNKAKASVEMAKASQLQAKVALQQAEREYRRMKKLKESGLATEQSMDEAGTQREAAHAGGSVAAAQLNVAREDLAHALVRLSKMTIYAPMDGVIAERFISVGDVMGDNPMFTIVDTKILDLTVTVPSKEMRNITPSQPLIFTTDAFPGETFEGKVMYINPLVNDSDRSLKVVAEVSNNPEVLKAGLFVNGRIMTGKLKNVLQTSRTTFVTWDMEGGKADLYVVQDHTARLRRVETGFVNGDAVEIRSGLCAGEEIISGGGFNIKDGDRVTVK